MQDQLRVGWISALMNPLTYLIVNGAIIVLVWAGAFEVNTGKVSQGEMIALVSYMTQILIALVALANLIVSFTKALASAGRINEVFAICTTMESPKSRMEKVSDGCFTGWGDLGGFGSLRGNLVFDYSGRFEGCLSGVFGHGAMWCLVNAG